MKYATPLFLLAAWTLGSLAAGQATAAPAPPAQTLHGYQNTVIEWGYTAEGAYDDPFSEVTLDVLITAPDGREMTIPAFWAGGDA